MTETAPEAVVTPAPEPVAAPEPAPAPAPEPDYFVIVPRDLVDEYASKGFQVGYAMLRPE